MQDQAKRFCTLIRDKLPWPPNDSRWIDVSRSANVMYLEPLNPIAHELAQDKITSARPEGYMDPPVVKTRAGRTISVDVIDSLTAWDLSWPILSTAVRSNGRKRYVVDFTNPILQ
jgi:hypothetical protein